MNADSVFKSCIVSLRYCGLRVFRINCDSGFGFDLYCSGYTSVENKREIQHFILLSLLLLLLLLLLLQT